MAAGAIQMALINKSIHLSINYLKRQDLFNEIQLKSND